MRSIKALSLAPAVNDWIANSRDPRILHVFDHACNLVNERKEVLSIVTPQIGNGPFNLVLEEEVCFTAHLNLESPIASVHGQLQLGELNLNTRDAKLWLPYPDWKKMHAKKRDIFKQLTSLSMANSLKPGGIDMIRGYHPSLLKYREADYQFSNSLISSLSIRDLPSALVAARKLAGLGPGLTPAGDDFLIGAIYAAWIAHPAEVATILAQKVANAAAPLTTSLSAAWLSAAGRGEAGIMWHTLFDALLQSNQAAAQLQITQLLSVGHSSGADALAGFLGVCTTEGTIWPSGS